MRDGVFILKLGSTGSKVYAGPWLFQMIPRLQIPRMRSEGITENRDLLPSITEARGAAMLKLYRLEIQGGMSVRGRLEQ